MYKIYLTLIVIFINLIYGQSLSNMPVDLNDENSLITQGLDIEIQDIQDESDKEISIDEQTIFVDSNQQKIDYFKINQLFGYSYFIKDINFYDNIPTPSNYRLGPGDEIIISFWGEQNSRESFLINKDGLIFYDNIGFVSLSNLTLNQAEEVLKEKFSKIYSTLNDSINPTYLKIELKNLKSLNVYITGEAINPGITLIHPFSDVFSAIVQSGGIEENGSLRNIQVIRNQKIIASVDFYNFFVFGENNFSNIRILDGDIIHIPSISNRVEIRGAVLSEGFYEMQPGETVSDVVQFANGFSKDASQNAILEKVVPFKERKSDDYAKTSLNLSFEEFKDTELNNGDFIEVLTIPEVDSKVFVFGRVKSPGEYSYTSSLRKVLDIAGGFDDPFYRRTILDEDIIVSRKDDNEFYPITFSVKYSESNAFALEPGDKIFVYENVNYKNNPTFSVEGEVNKPGVYPFTKGVTLKNALNMAGGLTQLANQSEINVYLQFSEYDELGNETIINELVSNINDDFKLGINSKIKVLNTEKVVRVVGQVYNPGLIALDKKSDNLKNIIELAGGYQKNAIIKDVYVKRGNAKINKIGLFRGRFMRVYEGDTIVVPENLNPEDFEFTQFVSDLSTTLANIAAILIILERNNN